jgi:hypothetical protein
MPITTLLEEARIELLQGANIVYYDLFFWHIAGRPYGTSGQGVPVLSAHLYHYLNEECA